MNRSRRARQCFSGVRGSIALALLGWSAFSSAQEPIPGADKLNEEEQLLQLDTLLQTQVAAATKVAQTVSETPSLATVIPLSEWQEYGWLTLQDILIHQPGFALSQDYDRMTVSSRGTF